MTDFFDKRRIAVVFLLLIISAIGFYIRYDNINHWLTYKIRYFSPVDNIPLPLEADAYYYFDIAQDILKGRVEQVDRQRQFPNYFEKPVLLPALSVILAFISKVSGKPLEWIAIFLPPFLAVLLVIPVYFFAVMLLSTSCCAANKDTRTFATTAGLLSALFAIVSPVFVERSSIGWCDTDVLNVALLCSLACIAMQAAVAEKKRDLICLLVSFVILTVLFIQWWDQATTAVVAFSLGYFSLAGAFNFARNRSNCKIFVLFFLVLCIFVFGLQGVTILNLPNSLISLIKYSVSIDDSGSSFRYAGQLVAEQQDTSMAIMSQKIAGNEWIFYLSLIGVFFLIVISRKYVLFLLPWLALLLISTKSHRVMIFSGVLFGLGIGTIAFLAGKIFKQVKLPLLFLVGISGLALAWFPLREAQSYFSKTPQGIPQLFDQFKLLAKQIPEDSVIWSSWGHGHALVFYTNGKTIGDGIFHPPELVYSQYVPYAVSSPRLAANWIMFYTRYGSGGLRRANELFAGKNDAWAQGMPALQELLGGGVEKSRFILLQKYAFSSRKTDEILSFLFPRPLAPIFFLLDYITYEEQWFRWGRASFSSEEEKFRYTMVPIQNISQDGNNIKGRSELGDVSFDIVRGAGSIGEQNDIFLKHLRVDSAVSLFIKNFEKRSPHPFALPSLLIKQNQILTNGILLDDNVLNSLFTKMFFLNEYDKTFFLPIILESPLISVYQVQGDIYDQQRRE